MEWKSKGRAVKLGQALATTQPCVDSARHNVDQLRKPLPQEVDDSVRFSARSVKAQRTRLGLSAADYARLVGVSPLTIYNWEHGKSRPRKEQLAQLVAVRGIGKREALKLLEERSGRRAA